MSSLTIALLAASCTAPPTDPIAASIADTAGSLVGANGLVRAPEGVTDTTARPSDLYLTAMARELLEITTAAPGPSATLVDDTDLLPVPWNWWTRVVVLHGTPEARVSGSVPVAPPERTGDVDADAVLAWAWVDAASRADDVPHEWRATAASAVAQLSPPRGWYATWRLTQARSMVGMEPPPTPPSPPAADSDDLSLEVLGHVRLTGSTPFPNPSDALRTDLTWPVCSVESMAAASAVRALHDGGAAARVLERCRTDATGLIPQQSINLGTVATTLTAAQLIGPSFEGLLNSSTVGALKADLSRPPTSDQERLHALDALALLRLSGESISEHDAFVDSELNRLKGTHPTQDAVELGLRVQALRIIRGVIELPTLSLPTEATLDPGEALHLLQNTDKFANGEAIAAALPGTQQFVRERVTKPSPDIEYYRAVAALPSLPDQLPTDQQRRVEEALATLRGCDLSPYLYRIEVSPGTLRCSFTASLLARQSAYEKRVVR